MQKRRLTVLFAVCVAVALMVSPAFSEQGAPTKSVKIGVISPLSGPIAFYGTSMLRCVDLAVKGINEKGTLGDNGPGIQVGKDRYKLEIVNYDDSADPAKSVAGMRRLAEVNNVSVILGPFGTPQAWACQEVNTGLKVLFNGLSTADESRKKGNPLYIQERMPALYFGDPMAQVAIDKGFKKVAILTDINKAFQAWGERFGQKFKSLGGEVLALESVDIKNTNDYHSIMTNFKAKNPDLIFICMYEEPSALATNHALDVGYKGKFIFGSDFGVKAEKIVGLDRIQGSLIEAMLPTYYRKQPDQDKRGITTAFIKKYMETYKEDYAQPGMSVYDPALMFIRAMEIAGTVTDAAAIRAACPKALQEGKLPIIFPNNDVLKNGLMYGAPEVMIEVKGEQYQLVKELNVPREILE